jgi:hypothetical protein
MLQNRGIFEVGLVAMEVGRNLSCLALIVQTMWQSLFSLPCQTPFKLNKFIAVNVIRQMAQNAHLII